MAEQERAAAKPNDLGFPAATGEWSRDKWVKVIIAGSLLLLVYLVLAIWLVPEWVANGVHSSNPEADATAQASERGSVRTAMLAVLAGAIASVGAIYTARTFALNRRAQITDRFTRAIDHLGSDKMEVRLGGIYALERIAHESPEEHGPIVEVLTAYVRENSRWPPPDLPGHESLERAETDPDAASPLDVRSPPWAAVDIAAILTVLCRRNLSHEKARPLRIDLSNANLGRVSAVGIDLQGAYLDGTRLDRADLHGAKLQDVRLRAATLRGTALIGAQLQGARLQGATFENASLQGANLDTQHVGRQTHFGGAWYNRDTVWPPGIRPEDVGAEPDDRP
jgi:hypothetical protein